MSYTVNHAIVVTYWRADEVKKAHATALEIYSATFMDGPLGDKSDGARLVSPVIHGIINDQASFFIAPDGSKEGWWDSDLSDEARRKFMDWLFKESPCDFVEVQFGGDFHKSIITRDRDSDLDKLDDESYAGSHRPQ